MTHNKLKIGYRLAAVFLTFAFVSRAQLSAADLMFDHQDAGESGVFNFGASDATVSDVTDEDSNPIFKLEFRVEKDAGAGIWTKVYPQALTQNAVDIIRIGVRLSKDTKANEIALKAEIKGTRGIQVIELQPAQSWIITKAPVQWDRIGKLSEVVVVVTRAGGGDSTSGSLLFKVGFEKLSFWDQHAQSVVSRVIASATLALLAAFGCFLLARFSQDYGATVASNPLRRDLTYAITTVLISVIALAIFSLGDPSWSGGWHCLAIGIAGGVVGEILKFGLTGRHLSPTELFFNVFVTGVLAATATPMAILQVPTSSIEVLKLCSFTSAFFAMLFHVANAHRLASIGQHLSGMASSIIVSTPFVFSGLLLVGSGKLDLLGQVMVVFLFNEAIGSGISLATHRRPIRSITAHLWLLLAAAGVVLAPIAAAYGSGAAIANLSTLLQLPATILATVVSQAGIWVEAYLLTGMLMDGIHGKPPTAKKIAGHCRSGLGKGVVYSGVFMTLLHGLNYLVGSDIGQWLFDHLPWLMAAAFGALLFPLCKTIIETFDGSTAFALRVRKSYTEPWLYLRGAIIGAGIAWAIKAGVFSHETGNRVLFGLLIGVATYAGVSFVRDAVRQSNGNGQLRSWRAYLVDAGLGAFIGAGLGFYLESAQVDVVVAKFQHYVSFGHEAKRYETWPFLNRWGMLDLGTYTGGVSLLFKEALAGVLNWSIAAWLFAINRTFLSAALDRTTAPIKFLFTRAGFIELIQHMIEVMRWGLWMSPIIFSFLRMMGEPTWYNQDGAIRSILATVNNLTMSQESFVQWSLSVFVGLLAYDLVRILIWVDHMGLRVATLVNFSFLGMDKIDGKVARFIGRDANARYIPEGVKRFTTWAPLLIPFYIPMGADWDHVWDESGRIRAASTGGLLGWLQSLSAIQQCAVALAAVAACTLLFRVVRVLAARRGSSRQSGFTLSNRNYEVVLNDNGESYSRLPHDGYDLTRRAYDHRRPCGRVVFIAEGDHHWPVIGNYPADTFAKSSFEKTDSSLVITNQSNDLATTITITLPNEDDAVEVWEVTIKNQTDAARDVKVVPYLEWVINAPGGDRGHTQYNRLFPEISYDRAAHASVAFHRYTKLHGFLASDIAPEGFLASRMDFIGRARSIWSPRALETMAFEEPRDMPAYPTFDSISSLVVGLHVEPHEAATVRFVVGCVENREDILSHVNKVTQRVGEGIEKTPSVENDPSLTRRVTSTTVSQQPEAIACGRHRIGHGEIPAGTPQPYYEYRDDGKTLRVLTPFTPRPYDHSMSNPLGHVMNVTNRGLHCSTNGNSQQNRVTPDWADTVTSELPGEVFYLYDIDDHQWYSPTFQPLHDRQASYSVDFSLDGTATFHMICDSLSTELTVFVPRTDPVGFYLLTVRNKSDHVRRQRCSPYFQIALADMPENAGPLKIQHDHSTDAIYFQNPRNTFHPGVAFASMTAAVDQVETRRGRFFGRDASVAKPEMVESGAPAFDEVDHAPIAGFLTTLEIPVGGECTIAVMLGQADNRKRAKAIVSKYQKLDAIQHALTENRRWWNQLVSTTQIQTSESEFDLFQGWLKYQAIAERIWARRGFYQASGAFGFRDQLQDSVNMIWVDPTFARKQIQLHAAQQFLEGDVVHWFFLLQGGRTGFACRSHAYDNLLWLCWSVVEYVRMTGDESLLNEVVPYLKSELPLEPLPKGKHGMGFFPHRAAIKENIYKHCLRAYDLVLDHRLGPSGLPLIGAGDWNDGLDEIGSEGRGESTWLGFFMYYSLSQFVDIIGQREGRGRQAEYEQKLTALREAIEKTWRGDRYLRAIHDDGTEIGVKGSGVWEIDALTAAWSVMSGVNPERSRICFDTAIAELERDNVVLLGHPALREDTKPYLGRSSRYPEGVRENGMYCHGDQWLVRAARLLSEQCWNSGDHEGAATYRETGYRIWQKISPLFHMTPDEIETYGGQPNKQAADILTTFDPGRMIWNGYTGAAGWMHRQAFEGILGATLVDNEVVLPDDFAQRRGDLEPRTVSRDLSNSPFSNSRPT